MHSFIWYFYMVHALTLQLHRISQYTLGFPKVGLDCFKNFWWICKSKSFLNLYRRFNELGSLDIGIKFHITELVQLMP